MIVKKVTKHNHAQKGKRIAQVEVISAFILLQLANSKLCPTVKRPAYYKVHYTEERANAYLLPTEGWAAHSKLPPIDRSALVEVKEPELEVDFTTKLFDLLGVGEG